MTATREDLILDLTQAVNELVKPRTHAETYRVLEGGRWQVRRHVTRVASLLAQLRHAVEASGSAQDGPRPAFGSKPAARLEAVDRLLAIDAGAASWVSYRLGMDLRGDTEGNLRALVGATVQLDDANLQALVSDARRWRVWARVVTGWDEPPRRLHSTCPLCSSKGTLRVRVVDRMATCVDCGSAWGPDTITLLAEHIRAENDDEPLAAS